jgi:hypothetical protein
MPTLLSAAAVAAVIGFTGYLSYVTWAWTRYGRTRLPRLCEADLLLDEFMPRYDVAERHHVRIDASFDRVMEVSRDIDLQSLPIARALIRARELLLGASKSDLDHRRGLMAEMEALGWRVLAEVPGREVVVGAVTQPWLGRVVFRGLPPEQFKTFRDPDFVKIAWTLRADPTGDGGSVFRTETRVATTDPQARRKFRWYWARFSPGIVLIRLAMLARLRRAAQAAQPA